MIVSEKSHQNLSDYFQLFLNKRFEFNIKKRLILVKKLEIQVIISMIMLTHSSKWICNPMRCFTGISFGIDFKINVMIDKIDTYIETRRRHV